MYNFKPFIFFLFSTIVVLPLVLLNNSQILQENKAKYLGMNLNLQSVGVYFHKKKTTGTPIGKMYWLNRKSQSRISFSFIKSMILRNLTAENSCQFQCSDPPIISIQNI